MTPHTNTLLRPATSDLATKRRNVLSVRDIMPTPAALLAVLAALYLYLHGRALDDIEARSLDPSTIGRLLLEHISMAAVSSLLVVAIAVPLGVALTRSSMRRAAAPILALANLGQAIPPVGVLVLLAVTLGTGFAMAVFALVLVAVLSVLRNTMIGIASVDRSLIDAARGMGLTKTAVLLTVELPLATPVILAGIRVAVILNVGSAALATYTNAGGLGTLIQAGIALNRMPMLLAGSVLTATLALALDWLAGITERVLRPRGI